jgi:hypothetical protein
MNVRLVPLIVGLLACLPLARSADQDVQARFEKSMNDAKSLVNVEIEFFDTVCIKDPAWLKGSKAFSRTFQYSYIASGLKYHTTCRLISGTETNLAKFFESTFDGELYASYDDKRYMTRSSGNPVSDRGTCSFNPLIAPFVFLSKQSDDCMQCVLRFTDLGSPELTNGLVLPKGQRSNGSLEISMPGLPIGKQPRMWKIALDEAGDSFTPKMIRGVAPGLGVEGVYKLLNYTNLGAYRFPTKIEWTESAYPPTSPPTLLQTGTESLSPEIGPVVK